MANPQDRSVFERVAQSVKGDLATAAAMSINDAHVRAAYQIKIDQMLAGLRREAESGAITWAEAAQRAGEARNLAMDLMRSRSSPVGAAWAEQMKAEGKTFNELIARYAAKRYGDRVNFGALSAAERDAVFGDIVAAAARSNPRVNATMLRVGRMGRGLLVLSVAISVYTIWNADDKLAAAGKEAAVTGGGILGGIGGGMLAGLACGPGAPVCVALGAFAGGAAVALGIDLLW